MKYLEKENSQRQKVEQRLPGVGLRGGEDMELLLNGYRASVWGDEKVLEIDSGDGFTTS